jgi:hypothetical protein
MNKWQHIEEMQNACEELTGMQDRILDQYDSSRQDHNDLLSEIFHLKQEFEELIHLFETKMP